MSRIRYETRENVAHLDGDDGKANSISQELLTELNDALDQADRDEVKALIITGRPGFFSAGFLFFVCFFFSRRASF